MNSNVLYRLYFSSICLSNYLILTEAGKLIYKQKLRTDEISQVRYIYTIIGKKFVIHLFFNYYQLLHKIICVCINIYIYKIQLPDKINNRWR